MGQDERIRLPNDRLLGYLDEGDREATPIVFCHGSPGSRLGAVDLVDRVLERGGRLIAPDRPGMGLSDPDPTRSLASWAGDVADLANALGLARFRVLGVSGGGPYALATAWALPHRVERVALVSSAGPFDIPGVMDDLSGTRRFVWMAARWQPRLLAWLLGRQRSRASKDPGWLIASLSDPDREALMALDEGRRRDYFAPELQESLRQGTHNAVDDMRLLRAPWGFPVGAIAVPVHLWHGEADDATPIAMGRWLAEMIPGCEAHLLPGEGHVSTVIRHGAEALDTLLVD